MLLRSCSLLKKDIKGTKQKNQKISVCYVLLLRITRKEIILYIQDVQNIVEDLKSS